MRHAAPLELEDDVVVLDLDDFARRTAEPELPEPRNLGGASASPAYVQRWVDAVDDARTGRRAKTEGDR